MTKFLNKAGMIHFLEKIKKMNHGMRFIPSISVRFESVTINSDEPENNGIIMQDGKYYDNKILFKIDAPQEWIEVAMSDENYKIILFHPSSRRKKWTSIDDSREGVTLPEDGRGNYEIHAVSLRDCVTSEDHESYFEYPYTIRHLLMRFVFFPSESTNNCLRDILYNGTQGEWFGRKGSKMYILGEKNATVCWGETTNKITNGFSTTYRLGLTYKTPFENDYIGPVSPSEFKARFGLTSGIYENGVWESNKLLCSGRFTKNRMVF